MFLAVIMQLALAEILQIVEHLLINKVRLLLMELGHLHQVEVNFTM